jgi:hypothetical protein
LLIVCRWKTLIMRELSGALCFISSWVHWSGGVLRIARIPWLNFRNGNALGPTNCKALESWQTVVSQNWLSVPAWYLRSLVVVYFGFRLIFSPSSLA